VDVRAEVAEAGVPSAAPDAGSKMTTASMTSQRADIVI